MKSPAGGGLDSPSPRSTRSTRNVLFRAVLVLGLVGALFRLALQVESVHSLLDERADDLAVHVASEKIDQVEKLEAEVRRLRHELESANNMGRGAHVGSTREAAAQPDINSEPAEGACSLFPRPTPSATSLWSSNLENVFKSTQSPLDTEWIFHDFTAHLLHYMTPARLQRSIDTPPHDYNHVGRVIDIAYKRWKYVKEHTVGEMSYRPLQDDPKAPPQLNILVLGGSVTMGVLCKDNPVTSEGLGKYSRRSCAWPARLEAFLNNAVKADVVRVYTVTLGGTNTESGITIMKYGILPEGFPQPDVVINAYATNDVHVNSLEAAEARNQTLETSVWSLTQKFIRTVKSGCRPPLLIYFFDYIGNEQNEILRTTTLSQTIHLLSTYYGTMAMNYADAVRDLVYADNEEEWFSPHKWFDGPKKEWTRQIHPGMGMHLSATWVIAYNLLHLVTTHCSLNPSDRGQGSSVTRAQLEKQQQEGKSWDYAYEVMNGLPKLRGDRPPPPNGPKPKPKSLPPELNEDLKLETVTKLWLEEESKTLLGTAAQSACASSMPCVFSFVCGLEKDFNKPSALTARIKPYLTQNSGWEASNDNGKLGYVPTGGLGSKFTLELKMLSQPVKMLTFMVMKSYGKHWQGSKVRIDAYSRRGSDAQYERISDPMEIEGEHRKATSETYNHEVDLTKLSNTEGAAAGDDLKVGIELVGGSTFKIMGLAFCDH